ncbi:hypothetical protein ACFYTS_17675 [Nocardia sp. NPDC004151]|uniref:hypothetical protein n=1 Tax=Nocardia sp. NPDC004151 TaxID=3364304 RepID=UPI003683F22B
MGTVDRLGAQPAEFVAPVGERPEGEEFGVGVGAAKIGCVHRGDRDRVGIDGVGSTAIAGGEDPNLSA